MLFVFFLLGLGLGFVFYLYINIILVVFTGGTITMEALKGEYAVDAIKIIVVTFGAGIAIGLVVGIIFILFIGLLKKIFGKR